MRPSRRLTRDQRRPFRLGLLDAILAEHALAGGDNRLDGVDAERFRDRHQRYRRRVAAGIAAGRGDRRAHRRDALRTIHAFHLLNACTNDSNFIETAKTTFTCIPYGGTGVEGA